MHIPNFPNQPKNPIKQPITDLKPNPYSRSKIRKWFKCI